MYEKHEGEHGHNLTMITGVQHIFSYWNKCYVCNQGLLLYLSQDVLKCVSCGHKIVSVTPVRQNILVHFTFLSQKELFSGFVIHTGT